MALEEDLQQLPLLGYGALPVAVLKAVDELVRVRVRQNNVIVRSWSGKLKEEEGGWEEESGRYEEAGANTEWVEGNA
jgi:hypothetical protein